MSLLFSEGKIGSLTLKNRIVMPAMHLGMALKGEVNQEIIDFYTLRAKGGVGLIVVGGCGIDDYGSAFGMIQLSDDKFIPGLTELTSAVKAQGSKIFAQLYQAGRYSYSKMTGKESVAPSPIASRLTGETPKELDQSGIDEIINNFALGALRAKNAGFDGIEILASAGYLISQFLSPLTNHRTDKYGGDLEARMRFGLEVVDAVRLAVGSQYPIMVRVAGNDFMPGSNTNYESRLFCQALERAGVNAINVTGGWHETRVPQLTMNVPFGAFTYLARQVKEAVNIPVLACNRINDINLANEIIAGGRADFVGMARPLIADPYLPLKAASGNIKEIRPCIGCNQGCLDNIFALKKVQCLVNPRDDKGIELTNQSKKVLIIGAGPAGMEAARVLALKGHKVTIWEAKKDLGGQLPLAAAPPGRKDFQFLAQWYEGQLDSLGVNLVTGKEATAQDIMFAKERDGYDEIVIATGAKPILPPIPIEDGAKVEQAWSVLEGKVDTGKKVVIVGGGAVGVETALFLAEKGTISNETLRFLLLHDAEELKTLKELCLKGTKEITIVEMEKSIGKDIGASTKWSMLADVAKHNINVMTGVKVTQVALDGVTLETVDGSSKLPYDTIIFAVGSQSVNNLFNELTGKIDNLHLIGDAQRPRKVMDAILEGYELGISL